MTTTVAGRHRGSPVRAMDCRDTCGSGSPVTTSNCARRRPRPAWPSARCGRWFRTPVGSPHPPPLAAGQTPLDRLREGQLLPDAGIRHPGQVRVQVGMVGQLEERPAPRPRNSREPPSHARVVPHPAPAEEQRRGDLLPLEDRHDLRVVASRVEVLGTRRTSARRAHPHARAGEEPNGATGRSGGAGRTRVAACGSSADRRVEGEGRSGGQDGRGCKWHGSIRGRLRQEPAGDGRSSDMRTSSSPSRR